MSTLYVYIDDVIAVHMTCTDKNKTCTNKNKILDEIKKKCIKESELRRDG